MTGPELQRESAARLDAADPLAQFRDSFHFPSVSDGEPIYFTGNSLGLMPRNAAEYVQQELEDWQQLAVEAHTRARKPWLPYHEFLTESMARIVGAMPIETVLMNSLTVNLHLLMISFYRPSGSRTKVMIERGAFPSDRYAVESQILFHGLYPERELVEVAPRDGERTLRTEDILDAIERDADSIALVLFGGVNYFTGQAFEFEAITEAGHSAGAVVGFDLAHAAGNLELCLHDWNVDFAAWCSYKYLNGGPGAVGGAFVHQRHARSFELPRFAGWWGHEKETRFMMGPVFNPLTGAEGWQISNPPILQMAALLASLEIFDQAGMPALTEKSRRLTSYLREVISSVGSDRLSLITPAKEGQHGCQQSISVSAGGRELQQHLVSRGVFCDWREPDVIRVAPVPLYNSFADVYRFGQVLTEALAI